MTRRNRQGKIYEIKSNTKMGWWNFYSKTVVVIVLILLVAIYLSFFSPWSLGCSLQYARYQSILTTVSAIAVVFTLIYATVHFRRAIAKPDLRITFDEEGSIEKDITIPAEGNSKPSIDLVITNEGDAVASIFQVDLIMPSIYKAQLPNFYQNRYGQHVTLSKIDQDNIRIVSICNNGMPFFVKKPIKLAYYLLDLNASDSQQYSNDFEIKYKVFGSWAERQEGSLKVRCMQVKR